MHHRLKCPCGQEWELPDSDLIDDAVEAALRVVPEGHAPYVESYATTPIRVASAV